MRTQFRKRSRKVQGEDVDGSHVGRAAVVLYVKALGLLETGCVVN